MQITNKYMLIILSCRMISQWNVSIFIAESKKETSHKRYGYPPRSMNGCCSIVIYSLQRLEKLIYPIYIAFTGRKEWIITLNLSFII